jgi:hypothetical protein
LQQALLLLGKFGAGLEALIATFYKDQYGGLKESCEDLINGGQQTVAKLWVLSCLLHHTLHIMGFVRQVMHLPDALLNGAWLAGDP